MAAKKSLTADELKRIERALEPIDRAWFRVGCRTGLRISEVLSLTIDDLLCSPRRGRYRIFVDAARMKGRERGRIVWLDRRTILYLAEQLAEDVGPDDRLFAMHRTTAHRHLVTAMQKAKIERSTTICTHSMRKTFANNVYKSLDKDLALTSIVLGHRNWRNTLLYIDGLKEHELWARVIRKQQPRGTKIGFSRQ